MTSWRREKDKKKNIKTVGKRNIEFWSHGNVIHLLLHALLTFWNVKTLKKKRLLSVSSFKITLFKSVQICSKIKLWWKVIFLSRHSVNNWWTRRIPINNILGLTVSYPWRKCSTYWFCSVRWSFKWYYGTILFRKSFLLLFVVSFNLIISPSPFLISGFKTKMTY